MLVPLYSYISGKGSYRDEIYILLFVATHDHHDLIADDYHAYGQMLYGVGKARHDVPYDTYYTSYQVC
jgi:hypothetical protein